jgi:hypothetical protein
VLFGAAEFSRDTDFAVMADAGNFDRLLSAMADLQAECIAVPPPFLEYLLKGHALHFRCKHSDVCGLRVVVMARMRGLDEFEQLWARRTTVELEDGLAAEVLSVPDLVLAKKTQRDKDWPMIRRLLETHYLQNREQSSSERIKFWLLELRTPSLLIEAAQRFSVEAALLSSRRDIVSAAMQNQEERIKELLAREEIEEKETDRKYWEPLRHELELLRHARQPN